MYTKAKLTDEDGNIKSILTFGPVCIDLTIKEKVMAKFLWNTLLKS